MKRMFFTIAVILVVFSSSLSHSTQTITLVADEWPPFNTIPGSKAEGYLVDIAKTIFQANDYTVVYKTVPWKRAIQMTRAGKYDGVLGASKTDAEGYIFPAEELARNKLSFYVRKRNPWRFREISSVTEVALGTIAGYDYRDWLNEYIEANENDFNKVQIITGDEPLKRNLQKMMNGWIDAVVDNEAAIKYVAKKMGISEEIECAGYGELYSSIYIAFSPNNPDSTKYAEMLSEGITRLRKNGELNKILEKYGLSDWK